MKDTIGGILILLSFTAFVLFIIGFFSPQTALFWYKKKRTKKVSALINGLVFFTSFILGGIILPSPSSDDASNATAPITTPATTPASAAVSPAPSTAAANTTSTAAVTAYNYQLAKVEHDGEKIECNIVINDMYPEEALIEKTRQFRDQYKLKTGFTCNFYYKRYADKARCMAVFSYWKNCNTCERKDKNGAPLYADYTLTKEVADSLRAIKFDTAGYNQEATYLSTTPNQKEMLFSSANGEALLVFHRTDGYSTYRLVKRLVNDQYRFYDPNVENSYFVIDRKAGFVDYYEAGELDYQQAIEE
jgi:hypothetical protein